MANLVELMLESLKFVGSRFPGLKRYFLTAVFLRHSFKAEIYFQILKTKSKYNSINLHSSMQFSRTKGTNSPSFHTLFYFTTNLIHYSVCISNRFSVASFIAISSQHSPTHETGNKLSWYHLFQYQFMGHRIFYVMFSMFRK